MEASAAGTQRSSSCNARRNQAKSTRHPVTNLVIRAAPSATPPAAWQRLEFAFLSVFCSIFLGFFLACLSLLQLLLLLLLLLLFFGVQLVRHERADSPSKDINSYGCRKGAEQRRGVGSGVRRVHSLGVDNRARVLDAQVRVASGMWQVDRARRRHQSERLPNALVA